MEVLAGGQKSLHEKRCFDEVAAIIEGSEDGHGLPRTAVHVVGPGAVVTLRSFEEINDLRQALYALLTSDESTVHADDKRHYPEAAGTSGDHAVISGDVLPRHACVGVGALPVVVEAGFLQHGEELVVL